MVTMKHPNGCRHDVQDKDVAAFLANGWKKTRKQDHKDDPEAKVPEGSDPEK